MKKMFFVIILLLILSYIVYFFPIQRFFAEKSFLNYIEEQEIDSENISSKRVFKKL